MASEYNRWTLKRALESKVFLCWSYEQLLLLHVPSEEKTIRSQNVILGTHYLSESHRVLVSGYINHICCMLLHLCNLFGSLSEGGRASTGLNRTRPTVAELRDESAHLHMSNTLSYKRIQTLNGTTHCGSAMLSHAIFVLPTLNDAQFVPNPE